MLLNCAAKQYKIPNMVFWTAAQLQSVSNILIRTVGVLHLVLLKNTYNVLELKII